MISILCWILSLSGPSSLKSYILSYLPIWLPFDLGPLIVSLVIAEDKLHKAVIETMTKVPRTFSELKLT